MTTLFVAAHSSKSVSESKPIPMPKLYDHGQITIICPERSLSYFWPYSLSIAHSKEAAH